MSNDNEERDGTVPWMQNKFADIVENKVGLFTRKYSGGHILLWNAADEIWTHLCNLDGGHLELAKNVTLFDLCNAYSDARGFGWRKFGKEENLFRKEDDNGDNKTTSKSNT